MHVFRNLVTYIQCGMKLLWSNFVLLNINSIFVVLLVEVRIAHTVYSLYMLCI